jgi:hypothetical protein
MRDTFENTWKTWKSGKVEKWKSGKVEKWKSGKVENFITPKKMKRANKNKKLLFSPFPPFPPGF